MTTPKFTPFVFLIGCFSVPNVAHAAGDVKAATSASSQERQISAVSVAVIEVEKTVEVAGEHWRIRCAKNPMGSIVLFRNETNVPLLVSFSGEDERALTDPLNPGAARALGCEVGRASYPLTVASEQGEAVLYTQLSCGDSVIIQSPGRTKAAPLEAINAAWAASPSESAATPRTTAGEH